jgi:hypothetical protein
MIMIGGDPAVTFATRHFLPPFGFPAWGVTGKLVPDNRIDFGKDMRRAGSDYTGRQRLLVAASILSADCTSAGSPFRT